MVWMVCVLGGDEGRGERELHGQTRQTDKPPKTAQGLYGL